MKKLFISTLATSAISATSLFGQSISEFDAFTSSTNSGSFTIDNAITAGDNAYVVFGYAREGGSDPTTLSRNVTAVDFGGFNLSQLVETKFALGTGSASTIELWGGSVSSLAAGNLNFSATVENQVAGNTGANFVSWIITGFNGISDVAGTAYLEAQNGGLGTGGDAGNIGFNGVASELVRDPNVDTSDSDFSSVSSGELILGYYLNGNNGTGGEVNMPIGFTITDQSDANNAAPGSYATSAFNGVAGSDGAPVGLSIDADYFRSGLVTVSFAVPEPSSYALLAGALMLGVVGMRRRRA